MVWSMVTKVLFDTNSGDGVVIVGDSGDEVMLSLVTDSVFVEG